MIKNLLLDMDMTILDFNRSEREGLKKALADFGIDATEDHLDIYAKINLGLWKELEKGNIDRDHLKIKRFADFTDHFGLTIEAEKLARTYEGYIAQGYYYLDGAKEFLESLQGAYKLYILSNGSSVIQHSRIRGAGLKKYVDGIYISEDLGYNKPDLRFFEACFADIKKENPNFLPEECLMIGDSLSSDMQGGKNAGIRTVWFCQKDGEGRHEDLADYKVSSFAEIEDLLATFIREKL